MASQTIERARIAVDSVRRDFPVLGRTIHRKLFLYLDNAGSSFYEFEYANTNEENSLSRNATRAVSDVRSSVANPLGATRPDEIVFLRSATEAVNLVAYAFERSQLQPGDEIVGTEMEYDSNFRRRKIAFLADSGWAAPHLPVDVAKIGCDFYAFSGHKMRGPMGLRVLDGGRECLERRPPYQVGGLMVSSLSPSTRERAPVPKKLQSATEDECDPLCESLRRLS
ncbi:MAG: aminotransferase class V-fold PLP-dependent enzyme [Bryobacteraceae bacterium]